MNLLSEVLLETFFLSEPLEKQETCRRDETVEQGGSTSQRATSNEQMSSLPSKGSH